MWEELSYHKHNSSTWYLNQSDRPHGPRRSSPQHACPHALETNSRSSSIHLEPSNICPVSYPSFLPRSELSDLANWWTTFRDSRPPGVIPSDVPFLHVVPKDNPHTVFPGLADNSQQFWTSLQQTCAAGWVLLCPLLLSAVISLFH